MLDDQLFPLTELRFGGYVRKSSESADRQVRSVQDQKDWQVDTAAQSQLHIVKTFVDETSAKAPGLRDGFTKLLAAINRGEINAILAWHINRLSRNPVDSGTLSWLLQQGTLKAIVTSDRVYRPGDNALILAVDTGTSTQYIADLRKNSWRGMKNKINEGWAPHQAPLGYLNDAATAQGHRRILVDERRWPLVRNMFDQILSGMHRPRDVMILANRSGLRTKKGRALSYQAVMTILTNPFYAGSFRFRGQRYPGAHRPMVTSEEFQRVLELLGLAERTRPHTWEFAYTGLIRCGECGCAITAETKSKRIRATGVLKHYCYYRCTKRKGPCSQPTVRVEDLERQIVQALASVRLPPLVAEFARRNFALQRRREHQDYSDLKRRLGGQLTVLEQELYNLNKTFSRGILDEDFFVQERTVLKRQIEAIRAELAAGQSSADERAAQLDMLTVDAFRFAAHAVFAFERAPLRERRAILQTLGTELVLRDRQLHVQLTPWLQRIADHRQASIDGATRWACKVATVNEKGAAAALEPAQSTGLPLFADLILSKIHLWYRLTGDIRADAPLILPALTDDRGLADWSTPTPELYRDLDNEKRPLRFRLNAAEVDELLLLHTLGAQNASLQQRFSISRNSVKKIWRQDAVGVRDTRARRD
jgi:site-specific DNA recombinase